MLSESRSDVERLAATEPSKAPITTHAFIPPHCAQRSQLGESITRAANTLGFSSFRFG